MTIETVDLVPAHEFEANVRARLDLAAAVMAAAAADEGAADEEVTTLRGDAAIGLIDRGKLLVAQRRLARAQETHETAKAAYKAVERQVLREREARDEIQREHDRQQRAELAERRVAQKARARDLFREITAALDELAELDALQVNSATGPSTAAGRRAAAEGARSWVQRYETHIAEN